MLKLPVNINVKKVYRGNHVPRKQPWSDHGQMTLLDASSATQSAARQ